ncbi:MAG: nucleotide pyrophosphatase/phosphodiesterase family protein [Leptospirales bacterium]
MNRLLVIDIPGLAKDHLEHMPHLSKLANSGSIRTLEVKPPAVTCSVQSTFLTGKTPAEHGVVANGWFFRDTNEVSFWHQSNALVSGEKVWEAARKKDSSFTCANMFWWFNMYSSVDYSVTPRPIYAADGRKIPDCYTEPSQLRNELTNRFGAFPLFKFWGPAADIDSTRWIRKAAQYVMEKYDPTLTLVYLPHLDYNLQRLGPNNPAILQDLQAVDDECSFLIEEAQKKGQQLLVLSEYTITETTRPIHINRVLRKKGRERGWLRVREEQGREMADVGASSAFAVCDHQIAHIYVPDSKLLDEVKKTVEAIPGVERVLDKKAQKKEGLDHERSGELVALSQPDSWFTYYYWLDDKKAPDYARTVDIHRKPGYDPVELFIDPKIRFPMLSIAWRILKKKLGFRTLMDVISLDATLVRGSHGRVADSPEKSPVIISSEKNTFSSKPDHEKIHATKVKSLMLKMIFSKLPFLDKTGF